MARPVRSQLVAGSGALGEMMNEVADYYQKDVEHAVRGLAAQIEPIMIVLMGCMVLVVALGWVMLHAQPRKVSHSTGFSAPCEPASPAFTAARSCGR